jgi:CheY-like chemotaxis protein
MSMIETAAVETGASMGAPAPEVIERPPFPPRARVLIVDDIAENRMLLGLFCSQFGVAHESVEGGREAVEAARSGRFDVILMDIMMPGMDGIAATRSIRALEARSTPVIIGVTTAAEPNQVQHYLSCGMSDVVPKPINITRLKEALVTAFSQTKRTGRTGRRAAGARLSA